MGIDGIGKGPGKPPDALAPKAGATRGAGVGSDVAPFEVKRGEIAPATEVKAVTASPALEGVRSAALDVNGYVDAKVDEATAHLTHLSPTQLDAVKSVVRAQVVSDPHLAELVQHATGSPVPKEED